MMPKNMAGRKKVKRFVIDVNSFITLFINQEFDWLFEYVLKNRIEVFVDDILLAELSRVLDYPKVKRILPLNKNIYLEFVRLLSTHIQSNIYTVQSPDPEDDYLYNIALTANAKLLVTGEKALLNWVETPVETINLVTFKGLF